jgi:gluconate 2-dehydrogenase gamma chain
MSNNNKSRGSKHQHPVPDAPQIPSRRELIKGAGLVGAAAVGSATSAGLIAAESDRGTVTLTSPVLNEALEVLTAEEAQTLEKICECLIPSDEHGPGAREARAIHYIDRSLASHNSGYRHDYMVSLSAINDYARQTRGKPYYELIRDVQNSILLALQENKIPGCSPSSSGFFNLLRSHTIDGTFSDPYYGGNQNFVGWDMLRYPGIRLSASETDVAQGAELPANHQSAYDHATYRKMISNLQGGDDNA